MQLGKLVIFFSLIATSLVLLNVQISIVSRTPVAIIRQYKKRKHFNSFNISRKHDADIQRLTIIERSIVVAVLKLTGINSQIQRPEKKETFTMYLSYVIVFVFFFFL